MLKQITRYLAALMILCCLPVCFSASAQVQSTIRVYLRRLQIQDAIHIRVCGTYMLEDGSMVFRDGADFSVALRGDQLVLHMQDAAIVMGESMRLLRCESQQPGYLLLQGEEGMYEGDLTLRIQDGVIRPILSIHVEDYLLGVIPYEMGDSFPLEALKAQAVAARTYALRLSGSDGDYDVEDTTNDQAYKGRSANSPLSEQAVRETAGLCGVYQGKLAQCYYSASNGGQTELGQHVWPTSDPDAYGYMDMRDDPFDYENDASIVKRYTIDKKPGEEGVGTALHSALVLELDEALSALGYSAEDDLVRIDEIVDLRAQTPQFDGGSRLMTELRFDMKLSVRNAVFRATPPATTPAQSMNSTPSPESTPTATPSYSAYEPLDQVFSVTLPIFTTAEQAMGLSINVKKNELIEVFDIGSAFMIESRRYGHGVGMSQRGAQQMAGQYAMSFKDILAFYYPGMELKTYAMQAEPLPQIDVGLMSTPAPTPSPTPRPTLMPVTELALEPGSYLAVVSNIDENSSLNLRESPSLSADIKRRLYLDQRLIVLSVTHDGWALVKTDVIQGYVRSEYLQAIEQSEAK